jgi:hypothetical protein
MAQLIQSGDFVGPGEERTARYLEAELPAAWTIICNKELINRDGSVRETDFIILGRHTVFVVEEKSWSGPIHGNENGWVLRSGESLPSPLSSVDGLSRRLAGMLRGSIPLLKERLDSAHFVFGRVILSSPQAKLFVHDPRAAGAVLSLEGCEEEFIRHDRLQEGVGSIELFRLAIVERLTGLSNRPKIPRQVGDYTILEVVPSGGATRALRALHADGTERILKLIQRPGSLDLSARQAREIAILREYSALQKLAATGRVPTVDPYFSWDQGNFWVIPVRPAQGRSLRADRADASPRIERIGTVCTEAFRALADVHAAGVVHGL